MTDESSFSPGKPLEMEKEGRPRPAGSGLLLLSSVERTSRSFDG